MASRAQITEVLPETLPGDFVEWDEGSRSAQPVQSGSDEPGPGVGVASTPATQAAEPHLVEAASRNLAREAALSVSILENTDGAAVPHPVKSLSPALLSWRDIVVLVVVAAVAMIPVLFKRELETFDGYRFSLRRVPPAKPAAPQSTPTVPPPSAAATTAGEAQITSEASRRQIQKNAGPSQRQAQMMNDQLDTPTRLQMKATLAEQAPPPPGGFAPADISGSDNSNAIGTVFGSPKQPGVQVETPQVISIPSDIASGLLIQKTQPAYPLIAKTGGVSGTIVLEAIISKTGNVENLHVVSGPVMLRMFAVNAVRTWRFKPYMLQDQPTAFETTISVHFCSQTEPCVPGR
jgi:TonB family protein